MRWWSEWRACAYAQLQLHPLRASGVGPRPEGVGWCVNLPVLWACLCDEPGVALACDAGTTGTSASCRASVHGRMRAVQLQRAERSGRPELQYMKEGGVIMAGAA